jgi:UDPglucose 6-dehydrogenase
MVKKERIYSDLNAISEKQVDKETVKVFSSLKDVIANSFSLVILTDWKEFKEFDWKKLISSSKQKMKIYDFRNILKNQLSHYKDYYKL